MVVSPNGYASDSQFRFIIVKGRVLVSSIRNVWYLLVQLVASVRIALRLFLGAFVNLRLEIVIMFTHTAPREFYAEAPVLG